MTGLVWSYPPELLASLRKVTPEEREADMADLHARLAETTARIKSRVAADIELRNERIAALDWCRANGNPHRKGTDNG